MAKVKLQIRIKINERKEKEEAKKSVWNNLKNMEQDLQIEPEADSLTERHLLGEICVGETKSEKKRGPRLCLHRWPKTGFTFSH